MAKRNSHLVKFYMFSLAAEEEYTKQNLIPTLLNQAASSAFPEEQS